jgi:hypothetical protein
MTPRFNITCADSSFFSIIREINIYFNQRAIQHLLDGSYQPKLKETPIRIL